MTTATTTTPRRPARSDTKRRKLPVTTEQLESFSLLLIVLVVGLAAAAVSFTHVHDWTLKHSPPGTPDWFGWVNAGISDLLPIGAFLEMKRRRRAHHTYRLPQLLMFAGMALSLAAQLAVAEPSISGWLLSAVPSIAFMGLSKMVMGSGKALPKAPPVPKTKPATEPVSTPASAVVPDDQTSEPKEREPTKRKRVSKDELRRQIEELERTEPDLTRKQQAHRLGVSDRRIRDVANEPKELVPV